MHHRSSDYLSADGPSLGNRYELATFLTLFLSVAPLDVARINDVGFSAEDLSVVNMAKCPVLVSLVFQGSSEQGA